MPWLQQAQSDQQKLSADKQAQQAADTQKKRQVQMEQQKKLADERAKRAAEAQKRDQTRANDRARLAEQTQLHERTLVDALNPMTAKYNRGSLPSLVEEPTSEQARIWAESMQQLQTTQLKNDLAKIDSLLANGEARELDVLKPVAGSASGEIAPFQGDWKRAAIVFYFPEFFAR